MEMRNGAQRISDERHRQITREGWSSIHDDTHRHGQMAVAAARYAVRHTRRTALKRVLGAAWPWASEWWKPKDPIKDLVRAGALIAAEIDRLERIDAAEVARRQRIEAANALMGLGS